MVDGEPVLAKADPPTGGRLFLAVRPPPEVVAALAAWPKPPGHGVRWSDPARLHLTLRFLGRADVDEVIAAIDGIQPLPGAEVQLDAAVERLSRAVVIPARGLEALAGEVRRATAGLGRADDRPFVGHLTIGWLDDHADTIGGVNPVAANFEVRSMELLASIPTEGGHRYQLVRTWPLAGRGR